MLVCKECGSTNVQTLAWVDVNTNEYHSEGTGDFSCDDCNSTEGVREETSEESQARRDTTKYLNSIITNLKL